jgi:hypothetical protein
MRTYLSALTGVLVLLVSAVVAPSCEKADEAFDCGSICSRYKDCSDADYDATACADRCRDSAAADESFSDQADMCETCIDDKSCTGSFACAAECANIVP